MKLKKLIEEIEIIKEIGNVNIEINDVQKDSNCLTKGSLFICVVGKDFDGHNYVKQAENYGAVAVICEKELDTNLTQIIVKDSRKVMSQIASKFYNHPSKKLKIIGITGTNGKTTTSNMIFNILIKAGKKCGIIGTLGVDYNEKHFESNLTTPDPLILHKIFSEMVKDGINTVVMEVSAHALYLNKLYGIDFEVAVFTNLTQDHLDFFGDMDNYKKAKISFLRNNNCKFIVANSDDEVGREIAKLYPKTITYGLENPADVFALDVRQKLNGQNFVINLFDCIYDINLKIIGSFNVYNALAASTTCALIGITCDKVAEGLKKFSGVSGRLECVFDNEFSVFIDYAHTPDGLSKTLNALRKVCENRLICVFGCGGNRDVSKRSVMGEISGEFADFTVITTDNSRFEDPMDIISTIEKGLKNKTKNYVAIQDRSKAIEYALCYAGEGDVVVVAGKGAETYQEVLGIKKPFSDKDTIEEILEKLF